jgi:hypothetical protein
MIGTPFGLIPLTPGMFVLFDETFNCLPLKVDSFNSKAFFADSESANSTYAKLYKKK